jgi:hypothetical protein
MNKFLALPIKFSKLGHEKEIEQLEELGIDFDIEDYSYDGSLYVNPNQIVCFNKDSEDMVNLTLADGVGYKIYMEFEEFLKIVEYE